MNKALRFLYSLFAVGITAVVCSYFTQSGVRLFYSTLELPPFTPPNAVFPIVWSALYALMVISYYIVLGAKDIFQIQKATLLFLGQLFLQMVWCFLFFYSGYFLYGLIVMILLLWTVWIMIKRFTEINPTAGYLQYLYFMWLLAATYMNTGVVYLNGASLIL